LPKEAPKPNQSNLEKLWEENLPDRFDIYSAGITLIQVLLPALRNDYELAIFKNELRECEYDLLRWRRVKCSFPEAYLKPLDENAGCGWDFLGKLLAEKRKDRITAQEMLAHEFLNF
jgi:serine/threonine protein kinase